MRKNGGHSLIQIRDGLQRDTAETWVGWRFRGMVSGSFLVSLVLAIFVFAAFPRVWVPGAAAFAAEAASGGRPGTRSGFNDKVTLGRVGRIMLSQQRVLFFGITSLKTRKPVSAEQFAASIDMDEVRFRGNTLGHYHGGSWGGRRGRESVASEFAAVQLAGLDVLHPEFRVEITQDAPVGTYAFAPYPVSNISVAGNTQIHMRPITGTMIWGVRSVSDQPRTFTVECPRIVPTSESKGTSDFWMNPDQAPGKIVNDLHRSARRIARELYLTTNIDDELPRLEALTNQLCTQDGIRISEAARVRAVMQYLSAENGFTYSTVQTRHDRSIDPVEDFLFNTKSGHCEYFASACALMLQSVQVPARLVNGYYGAISIHDWQKRNPSAARTQLGRSVSGQSLADAGAHSSGTTTKDGFSRKA
ncbi:MAG: transglutaminaseTgpA domain-containing protein [Planctomycetaceae bacterium]